MEGVRPPLPEGHRRFLDHVRQRIRDSGLSYSTEKTYLHWIRRFIRFHGFRSSDDMKPRHIEAYLGHRAGPLRCAANTQRTALNALVFLYQKHLEIEIGSLSIRYAKRGRRIPTVFSHDEAMAVIAALNGTHRLVGQLMYGSGLRVNEALRLRVKDIDFAQQQITVRDGKGMHDRVTLLPASVTADVHQQMARVRDLLAYDKARGSARVYLPDALARKYPEAGASLGWQFLFPAPAPSSARSTT